MNRALGLVPIALGFGWLAGGVGAVSQGLALESRQTEMKIQEVESLDARTKEALAAIADRRATVEEREDTRVDEANSVVEQRQTTLDEARQKYQPLVDDKTAALTAANEVGSARKIRRAQASLDRALKKQKAATRRPAEKLARAESKYTAAVERRATKLATLDEEVAAIEAEKTASLEAIEEREAVMTAPSPLKPLLGATFGLLLIGLGIGMTAMKSKGSLEAFEENFDAPSVVTPPAPPSTEVVRAQRTTPPLLGSASDTISPANPLPAPVMEPNATEITSPHDPAAAPRVEVN